jgi:hypothetical protein
MTSDLVALVDWAERELEGLKFGKLEIVVVVHEGRVGHIQRSVTVTSRGPVSTATPTSRGSSGKRKRRQP